MDAADHTRGDGYLKESMEAKVRDIPASTLLTTAEIIMAILLLLNVWLVFAVNRESNELSDTMQNSGLYLEEISSLQVGANTLSETASIFIQTPVDSDGSTRFGPLMTYVEELGRDRRPQQIAERFRSYDVADEAKQIVDHAAETASTMFETQTHAIALMRSVHPLPPIPALSAVPDVPLTEEELGMAPEEREALSRQLMLSGDYSLLKSSLAEDMRNANRIIQQNYSHRAAETREDVARLRILQWVVIVCIAATVLCTFAMLRLWIVKPLRLHAAEISRDESMKPISKIREMRILANAYNALLKRRDRLEAILRSAAETDALTGLPNRYSMERCALELEEDGGSIAVLVFDANFLKKINDTEGHLAGDNLIRTAAGCIRECFSAEGGDNCFRIGGDEFCAILRHCRRADVKERLNRFEQALKRENISVSVGSAWSEKLGEGSFRRLLGEADERMYAKKRKAHEARS